MDVITDVDGGRWVPVQESVLRELVEGFEAKRPKGRWAMDYDCGAVVYVCSICNDAYWVEFDTDPAPNYCPNCGARMEG